MQSKTYHVLRPVHSHYSVRVRKRSNKAWPLVHTHNTLLTLPSHSNAGVIFLGTCLRLLALQSPGLREKLLQVPQWPDIVQQPATAAPEGARLSVPALMQPAAGVVIDSAPSRLTPDIAAR